MFWKKSPLQIKKKLTYSANSPVLNDLVTVNVPASLLLSIVVTPWLLTIKGPQSKPL
jgi:hypothetical protein